MREILTALGVLIIIVLAGAMVGPHFVDWGRHRALIETHLSDMAGHPVRVDGPIVLTLLPTPSLSLDQVRVGEMNAEGKPLLTAERIQAALAPMALLKGDIHFTEATIDAPVATIGPEGVRLPRGAGSGFGAPESVSVERLLIRDGVLTVTRRNKEALVFSAIGGEIEATSLIGPVKGNASFLFEDNRRLVRFSVGKVDRGLTRLKMLIEDPQTAVRIDVDGQAAFNPAAGKAFDGVATLFANPALGVDDKVQMPVNATTKLRVADGVAHLDEMTLSIGAETQPASFAGAGRVTIAARPAYDLTLAARSYDFDRPGADGKPKYAVPADLIRRAMELAPSPGKPLDLEGRIDLSLGALIMGGQTVMAPRLVLSQLPTGLNVERFSAELPGQSRVDFMRDPAARIGPIAGNVQFESRDPERLHGWFNGIPRVLTAHATLKASANLRSSDDGVLIERLEMDRGATHLSGAGRYGLAMPGRRPLPHLMLRLTSPRLEVADIPAFVVGERPEVKPDLDFSIDVEAGKLVLDGNETGRLTFKARRDGAITSIDRVAISDFGGASLIASGALGGGARRVTLKLDAQKGDAIAALAEQVFPGPLTAGLRKRAGLLSPALVVASLANDLSDESYTLTAEGRMAGTDVKAAGKVIAKADIDIDLGVLAQNADGARLAQQIGAGRSAVASTLPGLVDLRVSGNPRAAMDVTMKAGLAGVAADVTGKIRLFQPFSPFEGLLRARSSDIQPFLAAIGVEGVTVPSGVASTLEAKVASNLQQFSLLDLRASLGGSPMSGELSFRLGEGGKLAGQIRTPLFDLRPMLGLALGPVKTLHGGRGWPTEALAKPLASPFFGDLWIETEQAQIDDALALKPARFVLRFDTQAVSLEYAEARLGSLRLHGDVYLKRSEATAYLSLRGKISDIDGQKLWPQGLAGQGNGDIQLTAAGNSLAKIAQTLAGSGTLALNDLALPAFAPQALPRLVATPPETMGAIDAANISRRLDAELARGQMLLGDLNVPFVVIDGVFRINPFPRPSPGVRHEFSGTYDIGQQTADLRATTTLAELPSTWKGAAPLFTTQWRGPLDALRRAHSVDVLVNGYLAWALQREMEKAEIQDQDMRERAFFNRRFKAAQWQKLRAEEIAAFEKQQAEEAARAEKLRLEEAARAEKVRVEEAARAEKLRLEEALRAEKQRLADIERQRQIDEALRRQAAPALEMRPADAPAPRLPAAPPPGVTGGPMDLHPPAARP